MTERKYSVADIDSMRSSLFSLNLDRGGNLVTFDMAHNYAEDQLRTYLLAGVDPDDLSKQAKASSEARVRANEEVQAFYKRMAEKQKATAPAPAGIGGPLEWRERFKAAPVLLKGVLIFAVALTLCFFLASYLPLPG